jgi:hypothetical protein
LLIWLPIQHTWSSISLCLLTPISMPIFQLWTQGILSSTATHTSALKTWTNSLLSLLLLRIPIFSKLLPLNLSKLNSVQLGFCPFVGFPLELSTTPTTLEDNWMS